MLLEASVSPGGREGRGGRRRDDAPLAGQQSQQPVHARLSSQASGAAGMVSPARGRYRSGRRMAKGAKVPEDEWRACLLGTARHMVLGRRTFGILPSDPRCKFCSIPFRGPGGFVFRHLSEKYGPWDKNPNLCDAA